VLAPVDLAVSKIARLQDLDRDDIRLLVGAGLTTAGEIDARATQALKGYVGGPQIRANVREAVAIARQAEQDRG